MRHDGGDGRGRHKRAGSPETRAWHQFLESKEWLDPEWKPPEPEPLRPVEKSMPPARPSWLDSDVYDALLALREELA